MANESKPATTTDLAELKALLRQQQEVAAKQAEQITALLNQNKELAEQVKQKQQPVSSGDILAKRERLYEEREQKKEKFAEWAGLSTEARSQLNADKQFPDGTQRYRVELEGIRKGEDSLGRPLKNGKIVPTNQPVLEINAHSPEEAKGRYEKLCGITAVNGPTWRITPLGGPVNSEGQSQPDITPDKSMLRAG